MITRLFISLIISSFAPLSVAGESKAVAPLLIAVDHIPPYLSVNKSTGEVSGLCFERLRELISRPVLVRSMPWKRAFRALEAGQVDIIPCADKSAARESRGMTFVGPVLNYRLLLVHRPSLDITSENYRNYRPAFFNGDDEPSRRGIVEYSRASSVVSLLKMLVAARADYTILPEKIFTQSEQAKELRGVLLEERKAYMVLGPTAVNQLNVENIQAKIDSGT